MRSFVLAAVLTGAALNLASFGQDAAPGGTARNDSMARGKYLVEQVAHCEDCHTPKMMGTGEFVKSAWLKGTTLDFVPVNQPPNWKSKTPDITSAGALWTRWGEEGMVKFLETGRNPRGNKPDPPMPAYTLSHEDAAAVAAFLKTLR